jgi:hypothetical protein
MRTLPALPKALHVAALLITASFAVVALESAVAQQPPQGREGGQGGPFKPPHSGPAIGGTSLTLRDVWGPAKMPEPSMDNPGYDYPPGGYDLNGPPSQSPYPN